MYIHLFVTKTEYSKDPNRQTDKQAVGFYGPIAPPGPNAPSSRICGQNPWNDADATFLDPHISVVDCHCAARYDRREVAGMANFKMYLLCQFCSNRVEFFYNKQKTQTQKMIDQNFEIRILWFLRIFWNYQKRRRAVPLRPIWTIMVAAKLDQSRILVTKFHQNRSTLKGRSAGQRQTDTHRQTDKRGWK